MSSSQRLHSFTRFVTNLLLFFTFFLIACEQRGAGENRTPPGETNSVASKLQTYPYQVVTTTAMIADIVRQVAGDRAQVQSLMGAGVDPHLYRASRGDMTAMLSADVVFYNGLNLEGRMGDAFVQVATSGRPVFAVTELLDEEYLIEPEGVSQHHDPHVWMDPNGWMKATQIVVQKLSEFDSTNTDLYQANGETLLAEMKRLDEYARQTLASIPKDRRVLVTAHDAFNYFARAYGIEVRGIQGISTDSQAGMKQIEELVSLLVARRIAAVFTESSVSAKHIESLLEGAKAQEHEVVIGGELFSDAMGSQGTYEGTYIGMIDHNITTIVRALGGEAPVLGMNGKLKP